MTGQVSDRSLRVVVAAARAGSFSQAAIDLGMTQAAVSQAVRRAETDLGIALLERSRTGVVATDTGRRLIRAIGSAYDAIDDAANEVRSAVESPTVSISVSTSFATWWLLPRLPDFKRQHSDIELRLVTTDTDHGINLDELDLWIPLGLVDRDDLDAVPLCPEALVPVAAPDVAAAHDSWTLDQLRAAPLLHLEERYQPRFDWPTWFACHGIELDVPLAGDRTTDYSLVLHSALGGQGVALGWTHLVADLIADGRLVALAPSVRTDNPFMILNPNRRTLSENARRFRDWLVEALSDSLAESG